MGRGWTRQWHRDRPPRAEARCPNLCGGSRDRCPADGLLEVRIAAGGRLPAVLRRRHRKQDRLSEHAGDGAGAARRRFHGEPRRNRGIASSDGGTQPGDRRGSRRGGPGRGALRESRRRTDRMLRVNASGAFYCTRAVLPLMLQAKWGRIVSMASIAARVGAPYIAAYAASKHALLGMTRAVAAEVASRGITANAVCPGYVDTEMTDASTANITKRTGRSEQDARKILEGLSPQGRLMTTDEVAALTLFLCSA